MALRTGTPDDVDAMYALDLLCFDEPYRFDLRFMFQCVSRPGAIVIVAEAAQILLGFVIIDLGRRGGVTSAYVNTLDVHPDHRRKGLALGLMAEGERRAAHAGATHAGATHAGLHVATENDGAIKFYESIGYLQGTLARNYYGPGLNARTYAKPLSPPDDG